MLWKITLPLLSGLLYALAFPKLSFSFLAWLSFVPLLFAIAGQPPKKSFFYGVSSGAIAYICILYWIVPVFITAGLPFLAGLGCLLFFAVYIGVFTGLFCSFVSITRNLNGYFKLFFIPAGWASLEYARGHLLSGFPWALLGYSQWNFLPIIQIADITGVYGVSFLVMFVNFAIFLSIKEKKHRIKSLIICGSVFAGAFIYGSFKLGQRPPSPFPLGHYPSQDMSSFSSLSDPRGERIKVRVNEVVPYRIALLQGNIDQYKKWDNAYIQEIIGTYSMLVDKLIKDNVNPDLVIWPESSVPGFLTEEKYLEDWVKKLVRATSCPHLVGSASGGNGRIYNSAYLISKEGNILDRYDKIHLVPFGEYVPLESILQKFISVINDLGGFSKGSKYTVFSDGKEKFAVNICFEAIFPELIRKSVDIGFIINITNDGWYLKTSAPYQHFIFNVFRAVENRRPVVRCANTGISGWIDSAGRIMFKTNIYERIAPLIEVYPGKTTSFYTRFGDVFAWLCIFFVIISIVIYRR